MGFAELLLAFAPSLLNLLAQGAKVLDGNPALGVVASSVACQFPSLNENTEAFGESPPLDDVLRSWFDSAEFRDAITTASASTTRPDVEDSLVASFTTHSDSHGLEVGDLARPIVSAAVLAFYDQLGPGVEKIGVHEQREQARHAEQSSDHARFETMLGRVGAALGVDDESTSPADELLTRARELIKQNKYSSALSLLDAAWGMADRLSNTTKSRIANNRGICHMRLGQLDLAREQLVIARHLDSRSFAAFANSSSLETITGHPDAAVAYASTAMELASEEPAAVSSYVQALGALGDSDAVDAFVALHGGLLSSAEGLGSVGAAYLSCKNWPKAEGILRQAVALDDTDAETHWFLGLAVAHQVTQLMSERPIELGIDDAERRRLEDAAENLTAAVVGFRECEATDQYCNALLNQSTVLSVLGEHPLAIEAANTALLTPGCTSEDALRARGMAHLRAGNTSAAEHDLSSVVSTDFDESTGALAVLWLNTEKYDEVVELLHPMLATTTSKRMVEILAKAADESGNDAIKNQALDRLRLIPGAEFEALLLQAEFEVPTHGISTALRTIDPLLKPNADLSPELRLRLGDLLYQSERFGEAASVYRPLIVPSVGVRACRRYVVSCYNSGQLPEARRAAQDFREANGAEPVITEIEAVVTEMTGDLGTALSLLLDLGEIEDPRQARVRLQAAQIYMRLDDRAAAEAIIKANAAAFELNPELLMQSAGISVVLGDREAVRAAGRALRRDYHDYRMHLQYIAIALEAQQLELRPVELQRVLAPCAVLLDQEDGTERWILILGPEEEPLDKNDVRSSDPLGDALNDKQVGDTIEPAGLNKPLRIKSILAQEAFLFREVLKDFNSLFPDRRDMMALSVSENDFSELKAQLDARNGLVNRVLAQYRDGVLPLFVLSNLLGTAFPTTWATAATTKGLLIRSGRNSRACLTRDSHVVIDVSVLLAIELCDLLGPIAASGMGLLVSQRTTDQLLSQRMELKRGSDGVLASDGLGMVYTETTAEGIAAGAARVEVILDFIATHTSPAVAVALVDGNHPYQAVAGVVPEDALSSAVAALETQAVYLTDDGLLADALCQVSNLATASTADVIRALRHEEIISAEAAALALAKLLRHNFSGIEITSAELVQVFGSRGWAFDLLSRAEIDAALGDPATPDVDAFRLATRLVRATALNAKLPYTRQMTWTAILESLRERFKSTGFVGDLMRGAANEFGALLALQNREFEECAKAWLLARA